MNQQAIEILNKVKDDIRKHPEEFDMSSWDCGTTACIAGWICRRAGVNNSGSQAAAGILGLSVSESYGLWFTFNWPRKLEDAYMDATCNTMKAEIACQTIDAFIKQPSSFNARD